MEYPIRHLTEDRIRDLLAGLPDFDRRIQRLGRTKRGRTPVSLPAADDYPPVASLADLVAPHFSDKPEEVAFFRDMMRLQELWSYVQAIPACARAGIEGTIAQLREQGAQILNDPANGERVEVLGRLIAARVAYLESVTAGELEAIARCATEIEAALQRRIEAMNEARRLDSERRRRGRKQKA